MQGVIIQLFLSNQQVVCAGGHAPGGQDPGMNVWALFSKGSLNSIRCINDDILQSV